MERCEQETIININQADLDEGYFCFYTSREVDYRRVLRRIGGEQNLLSLKIIKGSHGQISGWDCKIPKKYLSVSTFKIGCKRQVSEETRAKHAANLGRIRLAAKSATASEENQAKF